MNKKGSHIGVIISFIVFVGMIVFLYSILAPNISNGQNKSVLINSLEPKIDSAVSGNLTTISVYADDSSSSCIELSGFVSEAGLSSPHIKVTDSDGVSEVSNVSTTDLYINKNSLSSKSFNVYNSSVFPANPTTSESCTSLSYGSGTGSYTISQIKTNEYIFQSKVESLISNYGNGSYGSGYQTLKSQFEISSVDNFGFGFTYQNGTTVSTNKSIQSTSTNIYSQSFPVTYVSNTGNIESGSLIVEIW